MEHAFNRRKNLDSIMKIDMLADLPPEEIKNIWSIYMKERSRLSDMLTVRILIEFLPENNFSLI